MSTYRRPVWICGRAGAGRWRRRGDGRASRSAAPYASDACAGCEVGAVSVRFAVYSVSTCMDEDSGAHHRGRQRRVSSAERTRTASADVLVGHGGRPPLSGRMKRAVRADARPSTKVVPREPSFVLGLRVRTIEFGRGVKEGSFLLAKVAQPRARRLGGAAAQHNNERRRLWQ